MRRSTIVLAGLLVPTVAFGGFRVSSFKKETRLGANTWNVASAIDGKLDTSWMVDPEANNAGQWIEIDLPRSEVDKIAVVVGWDKSEKTFNDYARIKKARVEVFDQQDAAGDGRLVLEQVVTFEDKRGWQVIDLPDTKVGGDLFGGRLRLTVTEVYPGTDYVALAVSEVLVHLKEIDANPIFTAEPPAVSGKEPAAMLDGNTRTFWAMDGDGKDVAFKLEAPGFGLSRIGIQPGPPTHARPKTIEVTLSDITRTFTLTEKQEVQWFELPAVTGYTGSAWGSIEVKVIDSYPGKSGGLAITEVKVKATNYEGI